MLSSWTQDDISVGGVRLHYYRTGHGDKRPLVLVHGFSDNGLCWSRTAHDLEAEYDVVMPDMRGHGLSARMRPGDDVDMAADLAGLIRGLGLKRPIVGGTPWEPRSASRPGSLPGVGQRFGPGGSALVAGPARSAGWPDRWGSHVPMGQEPGRPDPGGVAGGYREEQPDWPEATVRSMAESKKQLDQAIVDTLIDKLNREGSDWLTTVQEITQPVLLVTANPELGPS